MNFDRKTIRDFMQDVMRHRLLHDSKFNRDVVLWAFADECFHKPMSIDEKIDFLNALHKYCKNFVSFFQNDCGSRYICFLVDPVDTKDWNNAMNSIYQEAQSCTNS